MKLQKLLDGPNGPKIKAFIEGLAIKPRIGELALAKGLITEDHLGDALDAQIQLKQRGRTDKIGEILVRRRALDQKTLQELLSEED